MLISSRPYPDYRIIWNKAECPNPDWDRHLYYPRGRDALLACLGPLGLQLGDTIIVPAYICDSIISPLRSAGYEIIFLDIEPHLQFDPVKLTAEIKARNAKALLVVHYFGLPADIQRLMALCKPLDVKVIEDCSHGFLTKVDGVWVGSSGDAAIFSMRKTFAIPDGGALLMNVLKDKDLSAFGPQPTVAPPVARYLASRLLEAMAAIFGWPNIYSKALENLKRQVRRVGVTDSHEASGRHDPRRQLPSRLLAGYLSNDDYLSKVSERVTTNYAQLVKGALALGLRPVMPELPVGCVPQWAPFDDSSGRLVMWLREHGVGACHWPWHELPTGVASMPTTYPISIGLNRRLALLPVHQSIGPRQIAHMLRLIEQLKHRPASASN